MAKVNLVYNDSMKRWTRTIAAFLITLFLGTGLVLAAPCACPSEAHKNATVDHPCCKKKVTADSCHEKAAPFQVSAEDASDCCDCSIQAEKADIEQPTSFHFETPELALAELGTQEMALISISTYSPATYWQLYPDRSRTYFFTQRLRL